MSSLFMVMGKKESADSSRQTERQAGAIPTSAERACTPVRQDQSGWPL